MKLEKLRAVVRTQLMRRDSAFLALGAIYVRRPGLDKRIQSKLNDSFPGAPLGQAYVRWGLRRATEPRLGILIAGVGRLGNSVLQSLNVRSLGRVLHSGIAFYHRFDAVDNRPLQFGEEFSLQRLPVLGFRPKERPDIIWRTYALDGESPLDSPTSRSSHQVRDTLRQRILEQLEPLSTEPPRTLTVYLRSGDVFCEEPEPHYGQPPWAFFERVLEFRSWTKVVVVSEDRLNPVHALIIEWCRKNEVTVEETGASLGEAIRVIMSASNLTSANGTFIPSLLFLSEGNKDVFCFQDSVNPLLERKGLTIWCVRDVEGGYIQSVMSRNWSNSPSQRKLMVEYPKAFLSEVKATKL